VRVTEIVLRFDSTLTRRPREQGVARMRRVGRDVVIDGVAEVGDNVIAFYVRARRYRQPLKTVRDLPSLTKSGETTWVVESWPWDRDTGVPPGVRLQLVDVPVDIDW